jgi:histidinol dehydrogenase
VQVERLSAPELGGGLQAAEALRRFVLIRLDVEEQVRAIVTDVFRRGDEAVLDHTRTYDTAGREPRPLVVASQELDEAIKRLPLDVVAGLQVALANVAEVAHAGVGEEQQQVVLPQGQRITLREVPVGAAAVYVPGGRAPYPSTVIMGVASARAAGVMDVAVCSPPGPDGQIDPVILGACRLVGVERVYRMGGAQAIAALALGTDTVGRVDVIVGPGNLYVQEAKHQLSGEVGIDGFAGPSDLLVVLGADADPQLVALDLLAQAEHGTDSLVAAISSSAPTLDAVARALETLGAGSIEPGSRAELAVCALVQTTDARQGIELANAFAPEHLQLIGTEPEALTSLVSTAGCLFVGAAAATAFGDYVAGSNHILPTAGAARFASGLSPRHFRRRMAEVRLGEVGGKTVSKLAAAGAPIARAEGFEWHARSMEARAATPGAESSTARMSPGRPVGENPQP